MPIQQQLCENRKNKIALKTDIFITHACRVYI